MLLDVLPYCRADVRGPAQVSWFDGHELIPHRSELFRHVEGFLLVGGHDVPLGGILYEMEKEVNATAGSASN